MSELEKSNSVATEKALGEPFGMEYQEDVLKTRRNLLLAGAAAVLVYAGNLQFGGMPPENPIIPFFGLALKGMTHATFLWCLFFAVIYLTVHFFWASIDAIAEYRLRATGARVLFMTGMKWGTDLVDAPIHPRQSTLYSWWLEAARPFDALPDLTQETTKKIGEMVASFEVLRANHDDPASQNLSNAIRGASEVVVMLGKMHSGLEAAGKVLSSDRIPVSLARFDRAFSRRAISQNLRWLVLEFGFPLLLGLAGGFLTLASLFPGLKFWA
jgi:hypothetical protein